MSNIITSDDMINRYGSNIRPFSIDYYMDLSMTTHSKIVSHKVDGMCYLCVFEKNNNIQITESGSKIFMYIDNHNKGEPKRWEYKTNKIHDFVSHVCHPEGSCFDYDQECILSVSYDQCCIKLEQAFCHPSSLKNKCGYCLSLKSNNDSHPVTFLYGQSEKMNWPFKTSNEGDVITHTSLRPNKQFR